MEKQEFSYDPETGIRVWMHWDDLTEKVAFEYEQDVEPILEVNKKLSNDTDATKEGFKNEFYLLASIPNIVQMKWLLEEGLDIFDRNAWPQVVKKLNDPQWKHLRTTTARYGQKAFKA